jgi:hypothetical protein
MGRSNPYRNRTLTGMLMLSKAVEQAISGRVNWNGRQLHWVTGSFDPDRVYVDGVPGRPVMTYKPKHELEVTMKRKRKA